MNDVIAICKDCGNEYTTWLSDEKECPECEGEMVFKDLLDSNQPK